jgi:hypothetical protein
MTIREYTVKNAYLDEAGKLITVGTTISAKQFKALIIETTDVEGNKFITDYQDRIEIKEREIPDKLLESELIAYPNLEVVKEVKTDKKEVK